MKCVVMAGGQGSRLRPLTSNQPKPMLPIVGEPMMQHILRLLHRHGFTDVVVTVQFLASVIRNYFGDGSDLDLSLTYATEETPLGTAGSVKNAEALLDDTFVVISGDAVTDFDLEELVRVHKDHGSAVTVALQRVEDPLEFGIVITGEDGRVERFLEKPGWGEVFSDQINTGIYVVEPAALEHVPAGVEFDFSKDLFPLLLERGYPMYGHVAEGHWTDVGNLEAYQAVHRDALDGRVKLELEGFKLDSNVWLGEGAEVDPAARIEGPVYIGSNTRVEADAHLREYTVLGSNVVVKSGAFLHRAIVHDHAYVGSATALRGCVLGRNADVKHAARLEEGVVVADECDIGEGAVLNPQVKVYPFKSVEAGALVTKSIIWESRGSRALFGDRGVSGLVNIDVTPESAIRLAMAFASTLPKRSVVVAARDASTTARVIKRAMVAGANAAGVHVHDLEMMPPPVARFYARSARANAGFTVRESFGDPAAVDAMFFDGRGVDVDLSSQRTIERIFNRDELRKVFHHDLGELVFPARGREYYSRQMLEVLDTGAIRSRRAKVVLDYGSGSANMTGPTVLGGLGVEVLSVNATIEPDRMVNSDAAVAEHSRRLAALVRTSGADLGVLLDSAGERVYLVDDTARELSMGQALLAYVALVARTSSFPRIAVPVATSRVAARIAAENGGSVVWTKISPAALMDAAESRDIVFAGAEGGGYIFPAFLAAYDGLMSMGKLLELLARTQTSLSSVVDSLPEAHIVRRDVATPWEVKGSVMRLLLEREDDRAIDTTDGMKVFRGQDWVLVAPHPQEPVIRLWAEAGSPSEATALVDEYAALIEELKS